MKFEKQNAHTNQLHAVSLFFIFLAVRVLVLVLAEGCPIHFHPVQGRESTYGVDGWLCWHSLCLDICIINICWTFFSPEIYRQQKWKQLYLLSTWRHRHDREFCDIRGSKGAGLVELELVEFLSMPVAARTFPDELQTMLNCCRCLVGGFAYLDCSQYHFCRICRYSGRDNGVFM